MIEAVALPPPPQLTILKKKDVSHFFFSLISKLIFGGGLDVNPASNVPCDLTSAYTSCNGKTKSNPHSRETGDGGPIGILASGPALLNGSKC